MAEKMGKFCPEVKIGYAVRAEKGKKLPPASKYAIVVSKADLPSNVIYYEFCFPSVSRGQRVTDHILFGTPGTLLDWILRHKVIDSKKIKMFVLDVADVMIALQGHQDQSIRIYKSVNYSWKVTFRDYHFLVLLRKTFFAKFGIQTLHLGTNFVAWIIQVLSGIIFTIRICK